MTQYQIEYCITQQWYIYNNTKQSNTVEQSSKKH